MANDDWCIAVFSCKPDLVENTLVDLYHFVKDLEGVKDLHFIIRDRLVNEVVFSFRVFIDPKYKKAVESKINYKLKTFMSEDKFSINPHDNDPLAKYVAWSPKERIAQIGPEKFDLFCNFLSRLSKIVVDMAENKYFDPPERVEIAHVMSWMLGCTEYGLLSTKHMEIGYYDRINDKNHVYLKEAFNSVKNTTYS
jgi:hypothetical protein